ncbi:dienelactone hydrolase family protein [Thiohalorhabdus sp.]|uniref:dienelactone hydrolase family protein n=1 Tax=Thiohalorhabdus sp. TaxID=3094134 RepID=UPI002FC34110
MNSELVHIPLDGASLEGELSAPEESAGLVVFAHGSGSSRFSPRNNYVAGVLREAGFATFLFDLLTESEDRVYANRFDIDLLTQRLVMAVRWMRGKKEMGNLPVGLFGASTGAAAALGAAAGLGDAVDAVVSRGGRPDLAMEQLPAVAMPTLLIVGGVDTQVIELNREAYAQLGGPAHLEIVPGATHLFEEEGKLEQVASLAADWFRHYLKGTV